MTQEERVKQILAEREKGLAAKKEKAELKATVEKERRDKLTPSQRRVENVIGGIAFMVIIVFFGWLLKGCFNTASIASAPMKVDGGLIREYCLSAVREKLKSPSSAEFNDSTLPEYGISGWLWMSYVEADNNFGVKLRTGFTCSADGPDADHISVGVAFDR